MTIASAQRGETRLVLVTADLNIVGLGRPWCAASAADELIEKGRHVPNTVGMLAGQIPRLAQIGGQVIELSGLARDQLPCPHADARPAVAGAVDRIGADGAVIAVQDR